MINNEIILTQHVLTQFIPEIYLKKNRDVYKDITCSKISLMSIGIFLHFQRDMDPIIEIRNGECFSDSVVIMTKYSLKIALEVNLDLVSEHEEV